MCGLWKRGRGGAVPTVQNRGVGEISREEGMEGGVWWNEGRRYQSSGSVGVWGGGQ